MEKAFVTATANSLGWSHFLAKDSKKGSRKVKKILQPFTFSKGLKMVQRDVVSEDGPHTD